jgi:small-conductance mechanosensitive channel
MGLIRLVAAPVRAVMGSRLFQFAAVLAIILLLDYYSFDYAVLRQISSALKTIVDATIQFFAEHFRVGILTDPVLQVGLIIAYVYVVCLIVAFIARALFRRAVDLIGQSNFLWLRRTIAQQRGIAAYRAWEPLERVRPAHVPQAQWEETFAWPADNKPPYPPLRHRFLRGVLSYLIVAALIAVLLQLLTPLPALTWLGKLADPLIHWVQDWTI